MIVQEIQVNYSVIPDSCNPVCLRWVNSKGGFSVWVFEKEIVLTPESSGGKVFKKAIDDYSSAADLYARTQSSHLQVVNLSSKGLEQQEVRALNYLLDSPKVWEITKDSSQANGLRYTEVIVRAVDSEINQFHPLADFSVTIERPSKPFL